MGLDISFFRSLAQQFCVEFVREPYLCYTEHGIHARFFHLLMQEITTNCPNEAYFNWEKHGVNHKVSKVQKEYPMANACDASQNAHWDIAVIDTAKAITCPMYDYFPLLAVFEFGMNPSGEVNDFGDSHVFDDIRRLSHPQANVTYPFVVHLQRMVRRGERISRRDVGYNNKAITTKENIWQRLVEKNSKVEVLHAVSNPSGNIHQEGVFWITRQGITPVSMK